MANDVWAFVFVRAGPFSDMIHPGPYAARKRTDNARSGRRPPPDKNIEPIPRWGK